MTGYVGYSISNSEAYNKPDFIFSNFNDDVLSETQIEQLVKNL